VDRELSIATLRRSRPPHQQMAGTRGRSLELSPPAARNSTTSGRELPDREKLREHHFERDMFSELRDAAYHSSSVCASTWPLLYPFKKMDSTAIRPIVFAPSGAKADNCKQTIA
jgi:hypothetical protein